MYTQWWTWLNYALQICIWGADSWYEMVLSVVEIENASQWLLVNARQIQFNYGKRKM